MAYSMAYYIIYYIILYNTRPAKSLYPNCPSYSLSAICGHWMIQNHATLDDDQSMTSAQIALMESERVTLGYSDLFAGHEIKTT